MSDLAERESWDRALQILPRAQFIVYIFEAFTLAHPETHNMAKAAKVKKQTKSGAIRAYAAAHPNAGPTEISKALKGKGIAVSPAHVSNVRQADKSKNRGKRGRVGRQATKPVNGDMINLAQLVEARRFAERVGGVDAAMNLLQSLGRLLA